MKSVFISKMIKLVGFLKKIENFKAELFLNNLKLLFIADIWTIAFTHVGKNSDFDIRATQKVYTLKTSIFTSPPCTLLAKNRQKLCKT